MNLTKALRKDLVMIGLRKSSFSQQLRDLILEKQVLAKEILQSVFAPGITIDMVNAAKEDLSSAIEAATKELGIAGAFALSTRRESSIHVYRDSIWIGQIYFNGDISWDIYAKDRNRKYPNGVWRTKHNPDIYLIVPNSNIILPEHPFALAVEEKMSQFRQQEDTLKDGLDELAGALMAKLNTYKTIKQLLEHWPEAEELVAELPPVEKAPSLPAITTERLNTLIGLPSEK